MNRSRVPGASFWRCVPVCVSLVLIESLPAAAATAPSPSPSPFIQVSADGRGFQLGASGTRFVPWGFNYDHDRDGRLIEDYWHSEWETVAADFREMKALGANVVRVHLQFARFMRSATEPNPHNLAQLSRLLTLAEETGLHLDVTGLGCYHKLDVPAWYDTLNESGRWAAQAVFWGAVAKTCARSPAIFCYDLMNEPVVPAGRNKPGEWLGPPFAGKHFVQFISLDSAERERAAIGRQWVEHLARAIRAHDARHLITVGLVDWSLERPGLTSGFVPSKVAGPLDFLCVHLYPRTGKVKEDLDTLAGFAAVGKPVVIEETFPLQCSMETFGEFIESSRQHAAGWLGFYWGKTPAELGTMTNSIAEAITKQWLEFFERHPLRQAPVVARPTLTLARTNHWLIIRGPHLPGEVRINYLEAYCRAGSTDADWVQHTVIPHTNRLLSLSADSKALKLKDTLADGVTVEHTITAGDDEVDFRLVAHNPGPKRSEAHWAQPCVRLSDFMGFDERTANNATDYLPRCFIFLDGQLTRLPTHDWATQARYVPGQTWCPAHVPRTDVNPRPLSPLVPSNGLIGAFSADEKWVFATAWEPYQELFQGIIRCLHSDFRLGGLAPGETKTIRGKIYLMPGSISALLERYTRDFPEHLAKSSN